MLLVRYFDGPDWLPEHTDAVFLFRCASRKASEGVICGSCGRNSVGSGVPAFSSLTASELLFVRCDFSEDDFDLLLVITGCGSAGWFSNKVSFCRSVAELSIPSKSAIHRGTLSSKAVNELKAVSAMMKHGRRRTFGQ